MLEAETNFPACMSQASAKTDGFHPSASRKSGNRSFGTSAGVASSFVAVVFVLLLIRGEDGSPLQGSEMWGPLTQGVALG
jgi:hypothetical protein